MKTILLSIIIAVLLSVSGCKEPEKYLRIVEKEVVIAAEEIEATITVEASASWMVDVSGLPEWIDEFEYDEAGGTFTVKLPSEGNATLESRSTVIRVDSGDGLTASVHLTQLAMDAVIVLTPAALEPFDGNGAPEQTLTVEAYPAEWTFTEDMDWLTVARGEGDLYNTLVLTAARSQQFEERSGEIVVRHIAEAFETLADTLAVTQRGVNLFLVSDPESIPIDPETLEIGLPAEGIEINLTVLAVADWTVSVDQPEEGRATLEITGGEMNDTDGIELPLTVPENTAGERYEFTLVFECGGEQYTYKCVQAAAVSED